MTTQLDHLNEIKLLFAELAAGRQEYDFQPPAMVSHAEQYAAQPERLRAYAKQVVCGRIMIFLAFSRMNTQALLQTYLLGVDSKQSVPPADCSTFAAGATLSRSRHNEDD